MLTTKGSLQLLIGIPIYYYVDHFKSHEVSNDPVAWGVLGDYFGGILNPILSFLSLCILGYLTYVVAREANSNSKRLFILERKMNAYDELAEYIKAINGFTPALKSATSMLKQYQAFPDEKDAARYVLKMIDELRQLSNVFTEFYLTLFNFNVRYGHLFKYKFSSQEYRDLVAESKRVSDLMLDVISDHERIFQLPEEESSLRKFKELVFPVMKELHAEVETKLD